MSDLGQLVILDGDPATIGERVGALWQPRLQAEMDRFFGGMDEEGLDTAFLIEEADPWERRMRDSAPHVLQEMEATAEAAGVDADHFRAYTALKYCRPERIYKKTQWLAPVQECTSFMAVGSASGVQANLLHKNRDAWMTPQSVQIKQVTGTRRVLGGGSVGDLGLCHALNDAGLAGKTNTGTGIDIPLRHSIDNTLVLRHIAEECSTCEQAMERLQELVEARLCSNGINGTIWLFADREVGLIVEETPTQFAWRFIRDDVDARQNDFRFPEMGDPIDPTKRYATALARMRELAGRARPEDLNALGRSILNHPQSICHDSTNSTTTSVIPHDADAAPYWEMTVGHPNNTLYIPMSPWAPGLPTALVDGSLWELSEQLHAGNKQTAHPALDTETHEQEFRRWYNQATTAQGIGRATADAVDATARMLQYVVDEEANGNADTERTDRSGGNS
jgi:hypothetical protein